MRDLIRRRTMLMALMALMGAFIAAAHAQIPGASEYVVGPQDVLAVTVANEPTLSGKFTVVVDGTVAYPLLGSVKVGGLSLRGVERELTTRLRDGYLEKPVVSVALDQFGSERDSFRFGLTRKILEVLFNRTKLVRIAEDREHQTSPDRLDPDQVRTAVQDELADSNFARGL